MKAWGMRAVMALLGVLGLLVAGTVPPHAGEREARPVRIGVLAYEGEEQAKARWQPLARHLEAGIPGSRFEIIPLGHEEFRTWIRKQKIDFALTNPAHHVGLEVEFGATRIATLRNRHGDRALTRFGAVIFTRSGSPISRLSDLEGHSLAAVNPEAFGGFLLARKRLRDLGIDPLAQMRVVWLGFPQSEIVLAVLEGRADVGTVRTGVIEEMIAGGTLDGADIRILGARHESGFPLLLSTALYPEWPMARLPHTDEELARQVAVRLLSMDPDGAVARATRTAGWTVPLDYSAVHALLREFRLPPYAPAPRSWSQILREEGPLLALLALLLAGAVAALVWIIRMNRAIRRSHAVLQRQRERLEARIEERTRALIATNEKLRRDVEERMRREELLQASQVCLAGLQTLFAREDLDPDQRLEALSRHLAECFGARRIVLARAGEPKDPVLLHGPAEDAGDLLAPALADAALERGEVMRASVAAGDGPLVVHVAPIHVAGQGKAMIEIATVPGDDPAGRLLEDDLGQRLFQHVAMWVGHAHEIARRARHRSEAATRIEGLTRREREVLAELARGAPSKIMARRLGISVKTVELHRSQVLRKLGVANAIEAALVAMRAGMIDDPGE